MQPYGAHPKNPEKMLDSPTMRKQSTNKIQDAVRPSKGRSGRRAGIMKNKINLTYYIIIMKDNFGGFQPYLGKTPRDEASIIRDNARCAQNFP